MLDEECLRPGTVTDETFLEKLNQICATHQHFESRMSKCSRFLNDTSLPHSCFRIQHYAGKVLGGREHAPGLQLFPQGAHTSGGGSKHCFFDDKYTCEDRWISKCSIEIKPGPCRAKSC